MEIKDCKNCKNIPEQKCINKLREKGLKPIRRGWPDYWCVDEDGDLNVIEVKPFQYHPLKKEQHELLSALNKSGVKTWLYTPDKGFKRLLFEDKKD